MNEKYSQRIRYKYWVDVPIIFLFSGETFQDFGYLGND